MYKKIAKYTLKYKFMLGLGLIAMFGTAILNGASLTMVIPLVDKILVGPNEKVEIFSTKQEPEEANNPLKNTKIKEWQNQLRTSVNNFCGNKKPIELLKIFSLILFILIVIKSLFEFLKTYLMEKLSLKIVKDLRDELYSHIHSLSMDYFTQERVGGIMSRVINDAALVQQAVAKGWSEIIFHITNIIIYALIACVINFKLAIFAIVFLPCLVFPIIKLGRKLKKISINTQEKLANLTSILQETINGVKIVKAFAMESYEVNKFKNETKRLFHNMLKFALRHSVVSPLMEIIGVVGGILFLIYGGKEVLEGSMTKGQFLLFIIAVLSLLAPFKKIGKCYSMVQQALAAFNRIFEFMAITSSVKEIENPKTIEIIKNEIKFDQVNISYDKKEIILKEISFSVKVGEVIAFVGSSGAGKTSLVNLLPRFYDPYQGKITIDGIDIKEYSLSSLRKNIGVVTQETILFNDTIKANIAYGHEEISDEKIIEAAKMANAHNFIMGFEKGYETRVGDKGYRLSGGQRQRIAIARALLKNPPILILDEATSSLDTESEKYVQEAIERLMQGRTVLAIAHRLSTIKHADKIIVIDQQKIAQVGTHEELINREGPYKRLYELQIR